MATATCCWTESARRKIDCYGLPIIPSYHKLYSCCRRKVVLHDWGGIWWQRWAKTEVMQKMKRLLESAIVGRYLGLQTRTEDSTFVITMLNNLRSET